MADLGAIGVIPSKAIYARTIVSPLVYRPSTKEDPSELSIDTSGTISGVVQVGGVNRQGVHVGLFHRSNMQPVAQAVTSNAGAYSFAGLDKSDLKNYFVVFLDPNTSAPWNYSLVRDHLTAE